MKKDWSVKEIVEPKTGEVHRHYYYKRKVCKRIKLESPMAKQLAGYVLIEKDLRSAKIWLEEINKIRGEDMLKYEQENHHGKDREKYNLIKGLFVAALTFYGKCFAQCEGRRVKLEGNQISEEFKVAHNDAISYRNNFAAHSGAKLLERAEIALVLPPKNKIEPPNIYRELTQPDYIYTEIGEKSFIELIEHVHTIPKKKIEQLSEKILHEEILPKGYLYWSKT